MTPNKQTINEYMAAFMVSDHQRILACLTDDVVWEMPGIYQHVGKKAFDKEIENDNFIGSPTIQIIKLIEENDIVIAEGAVQGNMKNGNKLDAIFCDVFEMENGKIKKLTSYLMSKNANLKFE
ncbi:nuclear transport factor 2 family protein [Flavobacterium sp. FlaQc-28]|uniref:nuclear transport factor 2 family protein n=1 Tax=Flavobacterium sp. FlaQc-28 TaxID=3374178 RepID=UPI0037577BC4